MMRAPSPCTKHSHGAKRWAGGHDDGPAALNVMLARALEAAAADAAAAFLEVTSTAAGEAGCATIALPSTTGLAVIGSHQPKAAQDSSRIILNILKRFFFWLEISQGEKKQAAYKMVERVSGVSLL